MVFAIRIEHAPTLRLSARSRPIRANIVGAAELYDEDQAFHCCLPFLGLVFGLRKSRDVVAGILERDEVAAARQRNRIIETTFPAVCRLAGRCRFSLQPSGGAVRPLRASIDSGI